MNPAIHSLLSASPINWPSVLDAVIADFEGATGTLHRLDPATRLLLLVAHRGIPPQLMPIIENIPIGKGIAGAAAERLAPVELCNLQTDLGGVAKPGARATNVQGSLAVPCLDGENLRGTIGVGKLTPHDFSQEEKDRLMEIGREIASRLGTP